MKGSKGFEKGISGNPNGRPVGSKNKAGADLKQSIFDFLENRFDEVVQTWEKLSDKDKLTFYRDLLQYAIPKLQTTKADITSKGESIRPVEIKVATPENAESVRRLIEYVSKLN